MKLSLGGCKKLKSKDLASIGLNCIYLREINLKNDGSLSEKTSRPMQGQSPYIINAALFYNDDEAGLSVPLSIFVSIGSLNFL